MPRTRLVGVVPGVEQRRVWVVLAVHGRRGELVVAAVAHLWRAERRLVRAAFKRPAAGHVVGRSHPVTCSGGGGRDGKFRLLNCRLSSGAKIFFFRSHFQHVPCSVFFRDRTNQCGDLEVSAWGLVYRLNAPPSQTLVCAKLTVHEILRIPD